MHLGRGSDARRKAIVNGTVGDEDLIINILNLAKATFTTIAGSLGDSAVSLLELYLGKVSSSLDIIRNQNVIEESETDPVFRRRVEGVVQRANAVMSRVEERIAG